MKGFFLTPDIAIGGDNPLVLFAGPCVIEDEAGFFALAGAIKEIALEVGMPFVFKASFDKANRSSLHSYRGPGLEKGLQLLQEAKERFDIPVLTDIHTVEQAEKASSVADVLQVPAFLCRQTDLVLAAAATGKPVNIKKGQFLSPSEVEGVIEKATSAGNRKIIITERGFSFGYNNLVVDMRSLVIMRDYGCPLVFDATHSVQMPGGKGKTSGGDWTYAPPLARAAAAVGIDGLFCEVHAKPEKALCDGPNMIPLDMLAKTLQEIVAIDKARREVLL